MGVPTSVIYTAVLSLYLMVPQNICNGGIFVRAFNKVLIIGFITMFALADPAFARGHSSHTSHVRISHSSHSSHVGHVKSIRHASHISHVKSSSYTRTKRTRGSLGPGTGSNPSSEKIKGYVKKTGKHVQSYHRTTRDKTVKNNYSTKPNYNPWTHKTGKRTYSKAKVK
jgi:hypothetical protein